jgi:hypothetical protein
VYANVAAGGSIVRAPAETAIKTAAAKTKNVEPFKVFSGDANITPRIYRITPIGQAAI